MKYDIAVLRLASNDLFEIHEYLTNLGENPLKKFKDSFDKFIEQVSGMPYMFSEYERDPKYRRAALAFEYLVFYRVDKQKNTVKIYRVLHGRRNIENLI
ncbi:MAG: type II toxin-antitoxin system RelE/ParE family toxin [Oscillospiraceae bacterium]|nr:type II toxin-antitoxin system RelE/ParE family toxin [Oscillospiraceae bacterium]